MKVVVNIINTIRFLYFKTKTLKKGNMTYFCVRI